MNINNCIRFDWAAKFILRNKADFNILESFVSAVLNEQVTITELLESESNRRTENDKYNRVDIKAKNDKGEIILVEVQQTTETYFLQRVLYGVATTITEHINLGDDYSKIKKVYSINILYFDFGVGEDYLYHGSNALVGVNKHDRLRVTANELHGIETVPSEKVFPEYYLLRVKNYEKESAETEIEEWMRYLKWGYIDPDTTTRGLHEAYERLQLLKMDKAERKEYEEHLWDLSYQRSVISAAKLEGRIEGHEAGLAEGRGEGLVEGAAQTRLEVVKKMKELGVDKDTILKSVGITEEEYGKIK